MPLKSLTVNMIVQDVLTTAHYYRDVLGFEFVLGVADGSESPVFELKEQPLGFAIIKDGGVELMLSSTTSVEVDLPDYTPCDGGDSVTLYIDVDDVEKLHDQIKDKVTIAKHLETTFYGAREFHIRDCNGYLLGFAQRPPQG